MLDDDLPTAKPFESWPRPLAFVLSGGGAFGPVQVGMLRALARREVMPDAIVGCSVGALNGALVANALTDETDSLDAVVDDLTRLWLDMDRRAAFGRRRRVPANLVRHRTLGNPSVLGSIIDRELPNKRIDELPLPFAAVATDAMTGEPELLSSGLLKPALMASAAVPGMLPPVDIDGRTFVDGGVAANLPIRQAIAFGARSVIALDATPPVIATGVPTGFLASMIHSVSLMLRNQRADAVDELASRFPILVLAGATPPDMGTFNFNRTSELLDASYEMTTAELDRVAPNVPTRPIEGG